jgi:ABC-2 type transport system permease protein
MFRLSLRLQRSGVIGMGLFGMFYGILQSGAYNTAAGTTAASHALFGKQMETFGQGFTYLLPLPIRVDTIGGYLQWRVFGALPMLFGFWAIMSASGATRGDEDHGLVEQWLCRGAGRVRYLATRYLVFLVAAVVAIGLSSAAIYAGAVQGGNTVDASAVFQNSLALFSVTAVCYALTLVAAQLTTTRNAAAASAGALIFLLYFLNGFSRSVDSLRPLARLVSPFYYYDRNSPLVPGGSFDPVATAGLLLVATLLAALAGWMMLLRDIGSPLVSLRMTESPSTTLPAHNPLLRVAVLARVYEQRIGLLSWTAGAAVFTVLMSSIASQMSSLVATPGPFHAYLALVGHGDPLVAIDGLFWIGIFEMIIAIFAITQVAGWSADDREGRLEMELTAPVSRRRVVAERFLGLLVGAAVVVAVSSAAFYLGSHASNINVPAGDLLETALVLLPFALSFGAVGALLASRAPRATIPILAAVAFASYLITEAGPLLKFPDSVMKLSVFSLVGQPISDGVYWTGLWGLIGITVVGFGLAAVVMQRREVGS